MNEVSKTVNFFWHGAALGQIHSACLLSFLRHGHRAVLHCYNVPQDLPDGVEVFDATRLMPISDLLADQASGSVAPGVDRYRYRIIQAGMGTYADCDMYLLRPLPDDDYLIGRQNSWGKEHSCNCAMLRYPADSALSKHLVASTMDETATLPWQSSRRRIFNAVRKRVGVPASVTTAPWGSWGPRLVSYWVDELGLRDMTQPIDIFYPLHYFSIDLLFEPGLRLVDLVTPRTVAVHLCHQMQSQRAVPQGSPMAEILQAGQK
jgi:hypothetical protein